jgi:chromosome segregation ATPase
MSQTAVAPEPQALEQLNSLERRIVDIVRLLQEARQARQAAEAEAARLRGELTAQQQQVAALRQQAAGLSKERNEVLARLEKLLQQVDSLVA